MYSVTNLIPRPLPSIYIHNNTQDFHVLLWTQKEGKNGRGTGNKARVWQWANSVIVTYTYVDENNATFIIKVW